MHRALLRFVSRAATSLTAASLAVTSLALSAPLLTTGCGSSGEEEEEFDFDGDDLRAAIVGTWSGSLTASDGSVRAMDLTLTYVEPGKDPACGNRELGAGRSDDAPGLRPECVTESSIHLTGEMTIDSGELSGATVTGSYYVAGNALRDGYLEAQVSQQNPPPDESELNLTAGGPIEGDQLTISLDVGKGSESWVLARK